MSQNRPWCTSSRSAPAWRAPEKNSSETEAQVAVVDEERCAACGMCVAACPYDARALDEERNVAEVDENLCEGCGACVAACLNKACELKNLTSRQIGMMVGELAE